MGLALGTEELLQHAAHVRALARRVVFDAELADDVEQEPWLAALAHAPRDVRDPRAWLATIVRHASRRLSARQARRNEHELRAGAARTPEPSASDPSGLIEREEAVRALLAAVRALPEPVRRAVVLHYLDGLTLAEVARRTGAPLETVRSRVKRGLELLRAELARKRGSRAWSVFLVRALDLAPPALARGCALVAREASLSLMLMSTTLKLGVAAAALLVVAGYFLLDPLREPTASPAERPDATQPTLMQMSAAEPGTDSQARREVESARGLEPAVSSVAPRFGTLALEVVWSDDGSPAAEVPVRLEAPAPASFEPVWGTTTASGQFESGELPPGPLMAQTLFGGLAFATISAGDRSSARLEIPVGIAVRGRVETSSGDPIAGADLFLSPGGWVAQYDGAVAARSDLRGEFSLRTAPAGVGACLSARAPGFAPSEQVLLSGPPRSELELTFVLDRPGRAISGLVLAPSGEPIVGAEVLLGSEREFLPQRRSDGLATWAAIGELQHTDASGRFELACAPVDAVALQVRAKGHPVWRGEVAADATLPLTIRLERGAAVTGTVRSTDGSPLAGIRVRVDPARGFASRATLSAQDGTYRLVLLGSGPIALVCEHPASGLIQGPWSRATTSLDLIDGAEHRWDPVLPASRELRGRLEVSGEDLDGWSVTAWRDATAPGESNYFEQARTDGEGRFVLRQLPQGTIGVALYARGGSAFPILRLEDLATDGPELILRPDPARMPTCRISGALLDERGGPVRSADIVAQSEAWGSTLVHPDPNDGTFAIGPLPAGEWSLSIDPLVANWAVARMRRALSPSQTWELGEVRLGLGGTLAVRFTNIDAAHTVPEGAAARLLDLEDLPVAWLTFEGGEARSRPLAPGTYRLQLAGALAGLGERRDVVIVAGEATALELEVPQR